MRAVSGRLPRDDGRYAYEIKWDGMRIIAFVEDGAVRLQSANLRDVTVTFPELAALGEALAGRAVILDGEVAAFDDHDRPSFGVLQQRMHVGSPVEARRRAATTPVVYMVFDVLHVDGEDTTGLSYLARRARLAELLPAGPWWQVPGHHVGDGAAMLAASKGRDLEGLVAKRVDSRYEIGRRSPCWIKVKNKCRQELLIGGWLPGEGGRSGQLGALLAGYYDGDELRYAGRVGTGFSQRELQRLGGLLAERARATSPFTPLPPPPVPRLAHWVEPDLVAEVEFTEWTREGILRHPSYLGLRNDKSPREVVRET